MSLLMQALKKAESAKQKQGSHEAETTVPEDASAYAPVPASEPNAAADADASKASTPARNSGLDMMNLELSPVVSREVEAPVASQTSDVSDATHSEPQFSSEISAPPENHPPAQPEPEPEPTPVAAAPATSQRPKESSSPAAPASRLSEQEKIAVREKQQAAMAQQKAKAVFASKQPPRNRRAVIIGSVGVFAIVAAAAGGYLYLQSMSHSSTLFIQTPPVVTPLQPAPVALADAAPAVPADTMAGTPAADSAVVAPADSVNDAGNSAPTPTAANATLAAAAPQPATVAATRAPNNPPTPVKNTAAVSDNEARESASAAAPQQAQAAIVAQAKNIKFSQSNSSNQINPALGNAYQLFISGDTAGAHQQYQKVLSQEANNRDALLGLAAIALNRKQNNQAGGYYLRLLELDPTDPDAIAGLTSLQGGDLGQNESRLKKILVQNPNAGAALFVLGNIYAQQSRWSEAQQAYFRAYGTAPANADYAFNLAVSLDRLDQNKLALDFYQRALKLAQNGPGNFNAVAVQARIQELQVTAGR